MYLKDLIYQLTQADQDRICPIGFRNPHSYRGFYEELAFEPAADVPVHDMLYVAKKALGTTYTGWKGGDFRMTEYTEVHLAYVGSEGEEIGPMLLSTLLGKTPKLPENPRG